MGTRGIIGGAAVNRPMGRSRWRGHAPGRLLIGALLVAVLSVVPIVFLVIEARGVGVGEAWRLLVRPRVGGLLTNTIGLLAAAAALCAAVGVAAAWAVERTDVPCRRLWTVVLVLPLAIPEFVSSFGWVSLATSMRGFWAALLVTVVSYYPFVFLPVAAVLRRTDPALEDSARGLGLGPWAVFGRVTLPQLRLPVLGGVLLIALHLLAEYGAFAQLRFPTFATEIYAEYQLGFDGASAAVLSLALVALSLLLLGGEAALRGRAHFARLGGGAARPHRRVRLGRRRLPVLAGLAGLATLSLGVPLVALAYWTLRGSSSTLPPTSLWAATGTTLWLALAAAAVTVVMALPVVLLAARRPGAVSRLIEGSAFVPRALPGVVIGLALVSFSIRSAQPLYQTSSLLVLAYALLFLPLALVAIRGPLAQLPPVLEDVARSLGLGPVRAFCRTTLPLLRSGIGAAAGLVFLSTVTELTGTLLLRPTGTETLATRFWTYAASLSYGAAAPYAAVMIAISAAPTYLLIRELDRARP